MMGDPTRTRAAFDAANSFLDPVLNRDELQKSQGRPLLDILSQSPEGVDIDEAFKRKTVIGRALDILNRIHTSFSTSADEQSLSTGKYASAENEDPALEDAKRRRLLHALLDLISLEGIYPSLSSGIGIPLQQRVISVLPAGVIAKQPTAPASSRPHDETLLRQIMSVVLSILLDPAPSIQPVIRARILSDIISGTADLAFNPNMSSLSEAKDYRDGFLRIVEDTPSIALLPTLSSFLQADPTDWFKSTISGQIARIPLRQGGVLQTIMFIASQFAPSLGQEAKHEPSNGPHFTVQAIMQISRLLSSIPQEIEPSSYFMTIAPQLLALLDGPDPDLKKTASYAIGNGILGKRAYGAPGTIGHSIFVEPVFAALTAELNDKSILWMAQYADMEGSSQTKTEQFHLENNTVNGDMVDLAIERLRSLALQHPNPGLVKRLIYPILLPLWALVCYTQGNELKRYHEKVFELLQTYFSISVGVQPLKKLIDHLLWDGGATWTHGTNQQGQVILKERMEAQDHHSNIIKLIDSLQSRADLFVSLLGSDPSGEERTGDIFLYVSERWLVQSSGTGSSGGPGIIGESENIIQKLVSAKVAERLLENFKDTLSRRPLRVLELIKQVVDGEFHRLGGQSTKPGQKDKVSLSSLANIVSEDGTNEESTSGDESSDSLSTAFSLLSTVLASPEFTTSPETQPPLQDIKDRLDRLIPLLPSALAKPATTSSMLVEIQLTHPEHDENKPPPPHLADLEIHRQALTNLNSELPPVQAEGFSQLSKLVLQGSPVLDIPSTLTLLLSIITDTGESAANDEFIYLNAIKLIGTLASRHPRTVVKTLVESYADKTEQRTLDQRLKIGESLLRTVQDLGEALSGETAKILGDVLVMVAGRRGRRPESQKERQAQLEKEQRQKEREERKQREPAMPEGWKFSTGPTGAKIAEEIDEDSDTESPEQNAHAANIVAAWAAGASMDDEPDDLRVRASALSILASAAEVNIIGLGPRILSSAVDLALTTLTLEQSSESAILRRASVVLILDILKALDSAREAKRGKDIGFGFSLTDDSNGLRSQDTDTQGPSAIGNIPHMLRILGYVESKEIDPIVRGHLRALVESLEAWLEKSLMWGIGMQSDSDEPRLELGDRIAGLDVDPLAGGSGRPRIEEIE